MKLGVRFAVMKDFNIGVALTTLFGQIKRVMVLLITEQEQILISLMGVLVDINLAYMFTKNFSANLGYSFLTNTSNNNGGTNGVALSISSSVSRFVFGLGYMF